MKKIFISLCIILTTIGAFGQNTAPRIETYGATGLFFEGLNSDTLLPAARRNGSRLGDVSSFGLRAALPFGKSRWLIKAGLGYSARHYSINKYSLGDFIGDFFLFDTPLRPDTASISYVRFTNQYLQVPVSIAYQIIRRRHGIGVLITGLNFKSDFLLSSHAQVEFDGAHLPPTAATLNTFKKLYTQNATTYVLTIEPYIEGSLFLYKGLGLYLQLRPFSFYSSPLNTRFTTGSFELFGSTFGIMYDFNRK